MNTLICATNRGIDVNLMDALRRSIAQEKRAPDLFYAAGVIGLKKQPGTDGQFAQSFSGKSLFAF
jgi:hypothetical protein